MRGRGKGGMGVGKGKFSYSVGVERMKRFLVNCLATLLRMLLEFGFFRSLVVPALLVCAENLLQEVTLIQNVHILYIYITSPVCL